MDTYSPTPVQVRKASPDVPLVNIMQVEAGDFHACALDNTGVTWCWGNNDFGQLGNTTITASPKAVQVSNLSEVKQIATGNVHSCAVNQGGSVYCWGRNNYGQLGYSTGGTTYSATPGQLSGLSSINSLTCGAWHTCSLSNTGSVQCWGRNENGQLGVGDDSNKSTPTLLSGVVFAGIDAGGFHTCGLRTDNAVQCWGENFYGQLGDGTTGDEYFNRLSPVRVLASGTEASNPVPLNLSTGPVLNSVGFRMLAVPRSGAVLSEFLAPIWTQGITAGGNTSSGRTNVWTFDDTRDPAPGVAADWAPVTNLSV